MSRYREYPLDCKVYVGNLGTGFVKYELQDVFGKFGALRDVWVARNPPGFAFIQFEEPQDAEDAVRALDGTEFCGRRIRVDMSKNKPSRGRPPYRPSRYSPSPRRSLSRSLSPERRHGRRYYRSHDRSRSRSPRHNTTRNQSRSPPLKSPSDCQRRRRSSSRSSGSTASSRSTRSRSSSSTFSSNNSRSKTKTP